MVSIPCTSAKFLGKHLTTKKIVEKMLQACQEISARMSLKKHFLRSHLDFFSKNNADIVINIVKDFIDTQKSLKTDIKKI